MQKQHQHHQPKYYPKFGGRGAPGLQNETSKVQCNFQFSYDFMSTHTDIQNFKTRYKLWFGTNIKVAVVLEFVFFWTKLQFFLMLKVNLIRKERFTTNSTR